MHAGTNVLEAHRPRSAESQLHADDSLLKFPIPLPSSIGAIPTCHLDMKANGVNLPRLVFRKGDQEKSRFSSCKNCCERRIPIWNRIKFGHPCRSTTSAMILGRWSPPSFLTQSWEPAEQSKQGLSLRATARLPRRRRVHISHRYTFPPFFAITHK